MGGLYYCAESIDTEVIKATYEVDGFLLSAEVLERADTADILPPKPPIVTTGQLLYFCISMITRKSKNLTIMQLELGVCSFAICSISTYGFTFRQPKDIQTRTVFRHGDLDTFHRMLTVASGPPPYNFDVKTPGGQAEAISAASGAFANGDGNHRLPPGQIPVLYDREQLHGELQSLKTKPFSGASNWTNNANWLVVPLFSIPVGVVHILGWHFHFPTLTELWLWRIAAITSGEPKCRTALARYLSPCKGDDYRKKRTLDMTIA
ncbi:hypothetical protein B0A55_07412 [Friedmanniomyces simplex]|uniref:Uncharacterized protein n=1 Tax=Friedmanniomyces simplex TaxID=329884 RepID=A0A4U0WY75_9PEZI|nr:hypothetical protein B0A55_07412 [Friedmanniomyces simplex]